MKVVYIALEHDDASPVTSDEIARLFGIDKEDIVVKPMNQCKRNERFFATLTDLYLLTKKYWYGLYEDKLTFILIKGVNQLSPFFILKYSPLIRFAISADCIPIFPKQSLEALEKARYQSFMHFGAKRIKAIKPYIKRLSAHYKVLFLFKDPFI